MYIGVSVCTSPRPGPQRSLLRTAGAYWRPSPRHYSTIARSLAFSSASTRPLQLVWRTNQIHLRKPSTAWPPPVAHLATIPLGPSKRTTSCARSSLSTVPLEARTVDGKSWPSSCLGVVPRIAANAGSTRWTRPSSDPPAGVPRKMPDYVN